MPVRVFYQQKNDEHKGYYKPRDLRQRYVVIVVASHVQALEWAEWVIEWHALEEPIGKKVVCEETLLPPSSKLATGS